MVDTIVTELQGDKSALQSVAATSHSFRLAALPYLFRFVVLSRPKQVKRLYNIICGTPSISLFVRRVRLVDLRFHHTQPFTSILLRSFTNLAALELVDLVIENVPPDILDAIQSCRTITSMTLNKIVFTSPSSFYALLQPYPGLKTLSCRNTHCATDPRIVGPHIQVPSLRSIELTGHYQSLLPIFSAHYSLLRSVTKLVINTSGNMAHHDYIHKTLVDTADHLEELSLYEPARIMCEYFPLG